MRSNRHSDDAAWSVASAGAILVVEDSVVQREHLVHLLQGMAPNTVLQAGNGREALDLIRFGSASVDIVICDLEMPEMDGLEFMRHLADVHPLVHLIVASSKDRSVLESVETVARAHGLELTGIIRKPVSAARMRHLLSRCGCRRSGRKSETIRQDMRADEIRQGLQAGEFHPVFQPKVRIATGRTVGVEALARWQHPTRGTLAPASFLEGIEELGLIDALTWRMIDRSAAGCAMWRKAGLRISVAVNLSLAGLGDAALADQLTERIQAHGLPPHHVVFEITERTAMSDVPMTLENLTRLRMKGFRLSIDDYGTGYSSLQQLARIPFSELKIDRSFVHGAAQRETLRVILKSSIEMAHKLRLHATAEGVETEEDWDVVTRLGCDFAQGYFIAEPMDAAELLRWTKQWRAPPRRKSRPMKMADDPLAARGRSRLGRDRRADPTDDPLPGSPLMAR